jgi:hypothetical protein
MAERGIGSSGVAFRQVRELTSEHIPSVCISDLPGLAERQQVVRRKNCREDAPDNPEVRLGPGVMSAESSDPLLDARHLAERVVRDTRE